MGLEELVRERIRLEKKEGVDFVDLRPQWRDCGEEIERRLVEIISTSQFVQGKFVEEFEKNFSSYIGSRYAVAVNNGTSALFLALLALGIGEGDEVVTVPFTFIATVEAIYFTGAKPVLVDVDPLTYTMDPDALEKAITERTKAVIPVHIYGLVADMDPIWELKEKYGFIVIEDACQAHGARYRLNGEWRKAGNLGDVGCFSFYPSKNLGAFGEGGLIATNSEELYEKMRAIRDHGAVSKNFHRYKGLNLRMENIQGAVLDAKLPYLDKWNRERKEIAKKYNELLSDVDEIRTPYVPDKREHVYHLYVIRTERRDELKDYLRKKGIGTAIHYPIPVHLQESFRDIGYGRGSFPVSESLASEVLSLPIYPGLEEEKIEEVAGEIRKFFGR